MFLCCKPKIRRCVGDTLKGVPIYRHNRVNANVCGEHKAYGPITGFGSPSPAYISCAQSTISTTSASVATGTIESLREGLIFIFDY